MSQSANPINSNLATNIGYRFDLLYHYYLEPTAGLEYLRTNFDHATALTATTVALNDGYALRAHTGARIGTEWVAGNVRTESSLLGQVYEIAEGTSNALLVDGTSISTPFDVGRCMLRNCIMARHQHDAPPLKDHDAVVLGREYASGRLKNLRIVR